jgi:hypothetical protein
MRSWGCALPIALDGKPMRVTDLLAASNKDKAKECRSPNRELENHCTCHSDMIYAFMNFRYCAPSRGLGSSRAVAWPWFSLQ